MSTGWKLGVNKPSERRVVTFADSPQVEVHARPLPGCSSHGTVPAYASAGAGAADPAGTARLVLVVATTSVSTSA